MLTTVLVLGMAEELWTRFVPKYLEFLGATAWIIAVYGTLKDLLDAVYQYPGGWLADRIGRKKSLLLFTFLSMIGYLIYLIAGSWLWILLGTFFVMAWSSLTLPALFAIIGDHLPRDSRAMGFGVQSIIKRIPIIVAPAIGGWWIAQSGLPAGMKGGLIIAVGLALLALYIISRFYRETFTGRDLKPVSDKRSVAPAQPATETIAGVGCSGQMGRRNPESFYCSLRDEHSEIRCVALRVVNKHSNDRFDCFLSSSRPCRRPSRTEAAGVPDLSILCLLPAFGGSIAFLFLAHPGICYRWPPRSRGTSQKSADRGPFRRARAREDGGTLLPDSRIDRFSCFTDRRMVVDDRSTTAILCGVCNRTAGGRLLLEIELTTESRRARRKTQDFFTEDRKGS